MDRTDFRRVAAIVSLGFKDMNIRQAAEYLESTCTILEAAYPNFDRFKFEGMVWKLWATNVKSA